jgi:SAM-dependent methyltransferase
MDPQYEADTLRAEESHWWYRGRRRIVIDTVTDLATGPAPRILDAGCGSGRNMVELARLGSVTGTDVSERALELARERDVGAAELAPLETLPFDDDSFDLITCLDVIEHIPDDVGALRELQRVVAPGGWLVVTVPAYPWLWGRHDEANHHQRRYTKKTLVAAATSAGWQLERLTHFNALLLPAAAAYRLVERRLNPRGDAPSELDRTPAWANRALERVLRGEARVLRGGRHIPFGLSLLGVFRPAGTVPRDADGSQRHDALAAGH